jgi:hypothetical protein
MEVTVLNGQSVFDLAVQAAGSVEAAFDMAGLLDLGITDELPVGARMEASTTVNRQIAEYYRVNGIQPATGITVSDAPALMEGVEFWGIEYDFVVS